MMICVMTRFHLRYFWQLVPMYLSYRYMQRDLKNAQGLIRYAFLIEGPFVCHTFSIWASQSALEQFANTSSHIFSVRRAKKFCRGIWSAYWGFEAVSKYACTWSGTVPWPLLTIHPYYPYRLTLVSKREVQ